MIRESRVSIGGYETRLLEVSGSEPEYPVVFVHGNPGSADDWRPFLESLDGKRRCLAFDVIGWGESERRKELCHTADLLGWFVEKFWDTLALERFDLVMHDWGAIALVPASWRPAQIGRIVAIDTVALSAEYRWHWVARLWRTAVVGELVNATTTRAGTRQLLRQAVSRKAGRAHLADQIHRHMDAGQKRAILELYRSAPPEKLGELGSRLGELRGDALVVWGDQDPYLGPENAERLADALGGDTQVTHFSDAGHWPWLEHPEIVGLVADYLTGAAKPSRPPPGAE